MATGNKNPAGAGAPKKDSQPKKKTKKIPERRCIGCGETKPKPELIRVVRSPDGEVSIDPTGKKSGRGAYICRKSTCLKRAFKSKQLGRNLNCEIPDEVLERLSEEITAALETDEGTK